ncbi:MAG TPA: hypothetical protein VD993_02815 [Chitinophagaceae bacterium]|nr:hypothetical protein [Chitinophagaceae bacterium]
MKTNVITPAVLILSFILIGTACRSSKNTGGHPTGKSYPVPNDPNPNNLPPGQAKKIYGDKSAKKYAPGQRKKQTYPLIITRTPDIIITRHTDGRNYYRNADGLYYWEGPDARFYLDDMHLPDIAYNKSEYDDWKNKGNKSNNGNNGNSANKGSSGNADKKPESKGNGKAKGKG